MLPLMSSQYVHGLVLAHDGRTCRRIETCELHWKLIWANLPLSPLLATTAGVYALVASTKKSRYMVCGSPPPSGSTVAEATLA